MPDILPELLRQILSDLNYQELLAVRLVNNLWYETAKSELKRRLWNLFLNPSRQASNQMTIDIPNHPRMCPTNQSVRRRVQSASKLKISRFYMTPTLEDIEYHYEVRRCGNEKESFYSDSGAPRFTFR